MAVTRVPQEHVKTEGSSIDDTLTPTNHDTNAIDLADTLDYIASQIADITGNVAWESAPVLSISAIDGKTFLDEKLALREYFLLTDITVPNTQNYKVLNVASSEVPSRPKAIGATTKGLITAQHDGTFATAHSLAEVTGDTTINPKNLLQVVDGSTGDPILDSNNKQIWGLLQHESGATDGTNFTDTTPERAQVSFVVVNSTNDDLVACAVADIQNKVVNLAFVDRNDLDSWVEQDFLRRGSFVDVPSGAQQVTLDNAIDNQGITPATQQTDIFWRIDDDDGLYFETSDGARDLLAILPAAAGDEIEINVDTLDVNVGAAGVIDFDNGITVDSGGQSINVGITAGQIDSTTLKVAATAGAAELEATANVILDAGANLVADGVVGDFDFTDSSHFTMTANNAADRELRIAAINAGAGAGDLYLEADDDIIFETAQETTGIPLDDSVTGPISTLFGQTFTSIAEAIQYAGSTAGISFETVKTFVLGSNYAAGVNIPAATLDLTAYTLAWPASGSTSDAARVLVYYNGRLLRGAAATGTGDIYPGTTPANGDLKHDFPKPFLTGDVLFSVGYL